MKDQILLPEAGYYKANLHCHTTLSDGEFTPEQIKAAYQEQGYSIVAFTDHRRYSRTSPDVLPASGWHSHSDVW